MKGIVFKEFSDMVETTFGEEMLDTVIETSDLPSGGVYTSVGTYPHTELVPIEIIVSKILESNITHDDEINESMYLKILKAAYEDGVITDMERSVLRSSAKQLGISKIRAIELEESFS